MSNYLAVATVTATLQHVLQSVIANDVPGSNVTIVRPGATSPSPAGVGVNIFLYQIMPNASQRNADLPTRDANGQVRQRPKAALDLYYLMSFYGDESKLEPQRVLGSVVRQLHSYPLLTRQMVLDTVANSLSSYQLATSDLADASEPVRFTPLGLSLEELSKLWSVFFQTPYALSAAYRASLVLIEEELTPHTALPVRLRNVYAIPFRQPFIDEVVSAAGQDRPITAGSTIAITGDQLQGDVTQVMVGGMLVTPTSVSRTQITLPLPAELRAGVQSVQVIQQISMGDPETAHRGFESNVAAFVLQPTVTAITAQTGALQATLNPKVGGTQRVKLLLYELNAKDDRPARAYSFDAPPAQADTDSITFAIGGVLSGYYLARVQVDGAESALIVDTDQTSQTFNQYIGPQVPIP
jgi:hypothetical protein